MPLSTTLHTERKNIKHTLSCQFLFIWSCAPWTANRVKQTLSSGGHFLSDITRPPAMCKQLVCPGLLVFVCILCPAPPPPSPLLFLFVVRHISSHSVTGGRLMNIGHMSVLRHSRHPILGQSRRVPSTASCKTRGIVPT